MSETGEMLSAIDQPSAPEVHIRSDITAATSSMPEQSLLAFSNYAEAENLTAFDISTGISNGTITDPTALRVQARLEIDEARLVLTRSQINEPDNVEYHKGTAEWVAAIERKYDPLCEGGTDQAVAYSNQQAMNFLQASQQAQGEEASGYMDKYTHWLAYRDRLKEQVEKEKARLENVVDANQQPSTLKGV